MRKRGALLLFIILIAFSMLAVTAIEHIEDEETVEAPQEDVPTETVEENSRDIPKDNFEDDGFPSECAAVDCLQGYHCVKGGACVPDEDFDDSEDEEIDIGEKLLREAEEEHSDAELTDGGIGPGSIFAFIDDALDNLGDPVKAKEEKAAEILDSLEKGDEESARKALEKYEKHHERVLENTDPAKRDEIRKSAAAIRKKFRESEFSDDEILRDVLEGEGQALSAIEIADKIVKLCDQLTDLGEFKKASEICNFEDSSDDQKWLRDKKRGWSEEVSEDAEKFFEVLTSCMSDSNECDCNAMPEAQQGLCFTIIEAEEECEGGNEDACDKADDIIDDFMDGLTGDLAIVAQRAMEKFEKEGFEQRKPSECSGVDSFEELLQ